MSAVYFILILTLAADGGYGTGYGGVAMQKFYNKQSCDYAGDLWKEKLGRKDGFYLCMKFKK